MLQFEADKIIQSIGSYQQIWPIPKLLEAHNPLLGEPLAERNAAFRHAVEMASKMSGELSETARLSLDFWKNFQPEKISTRRFEYVSADNGPVGWKLEINELGIFYEDVLGEFASRPGNVREQLLSDFWFFGPLQPMPDLELV